MRDYSSTARSCCTSRLEKRSSLSKVLGAKGKLVQVLRLCLRIFVEVIERLWWGSSLGFLLGKGSDEFQKRSFFSFEFAAILLAGLEKIRHLVRTHDDLGNRERLGAAAFCVQA